MGEHLSRSKQSDTSARIGKFDPEKYKMPEGDPMTAIIVGAGARGHGYSYYGVYWPNKLKIVSVCDPREFHRNIEVERHSIPKENVFADWEEAAARSKFADAVIICTPDKLHKSPAVAFANKGYHIMLEKPMAVTADDCREIVRTCKDNNVLLLVCHVLRYTPWVKEVKRIIDSGVIGDVVNINHTEPPPGAANRCLDCHADIESKCPYSAKKIYMEPLKAGTKKGWPISAVVDVMDIENLTEALRTGPYGRCVYDMDNDVMSHQVVNMQFENGATATMQMVAFTKKICERQVKIYGTKGEMTVDAGYNPEIEVFDFLTEKTTKYFPEDEAPPGPLDGHGGADYHTVEAFVDTVRNPTSAKIETGPEDTLASHLLVFAAEKARKENRVVTLKENGEFD